MLLLAHNPRVFYQHLPLKSILCLRTSSLKRDATDGGTFLAQVTAIWSGWPGKNKPSLAHAVLEKGSLYWQKSHLWPGHWELDCHPKPMASGENDFQLWQLVTGESWTSTEGGGVAHLYKWAVFQAHLPTDNTRKVLSCWDQLLRLTGTSPLPRVENLQKIPTDKKLINIQQQD